MAGKQRPEPRWSDSQMAAAAMPHGLVFEFALLTGMRPEEYLALQWSDVDITTGAAQIKRALVRHKKRWGFEEPKTARSSRTVFLSAMLLAKLQAHKGWCNEVSHRLS